MQLKLTEPQEAFVFHEAQYPAMVAGLGAGKSQAGIVRLIIKMLQEPGINTAYYMPTYDLLRLRVLPGIEETLTELGVSFSTNKSEYIIHIAGYGMLIMRSYDRPQRIISYEVAHSLCDELDTLPKEKAELVWRKITERNRQKRETKNTIAVATTPDQGFSGFVYQKWAKTKNPQYQLVKASTDSNPFLPDDYIEQIRANYDPLLAEMYINGEFVSLSRNKVYHFFDRIKHYKAAPGHSSYSTIHIGIDFNVGGCCATVAIIDGLQIHFIYEFVSQDTQDFVNKLAMFKDKLVYVYPDASGQNRSSNAADSDVQLIRQGGYRVRVKPSNPAIRDRVNSVNAMMAHGRFFIDTNKCPYLTDALESQGYDKNGEPEKFTDHPSMDDYVDGLGYLIYFNYPIKRPQSFTNKTIGLL